MAQDSDLEKTEAATAKRLEKAREEGDVARSREFVTCTATLGVVVGIWVMGGSLTNALRVSMMQGLNFERTLAFDPFLLMTTIARHLNGLLWAFLPLAALVVLIAIASPVLIGGWIVSAKAFTPNFARMNPISGIGNLFSTNALVELIKAIAKALVVGGTAYFVISGEMDTMLALPMQPLTAAISSVAHLLLVSVLAIGGALILIAAIDVPYQLWHYANKLKMTKEEVKQESKESEGNPQIKARVRQQQREMARRRMMSEIPKADVVITNPTHYAVAIKYKSEGMRAPVVIAKGADAIALKIREIAGQHKVAILEAPKLARALYAHSELGDEIPEVLYSAVAEVLAYIFQMRVYNKQGGQQPKAPVVFDVPDTLDPHYAPATAALLAASGAGV